MKLTTFYNHIEEAMNQENMSLEQVAAVLTEHGISGTEMDYRDLVSKGDGLAKALSEVGLPISCVYCFFDWGNHPYSWDYKRVAKKLSSLGIDRLMIIPGFVTPSQDRDKARDRMLRNCRNAVSYAAKYGIKVTMEDFDDKSAVYASSRELKYFMDQVPGLGCAFDTGNFFYSGEDSFEVLPLFVDRITYVHCKDRSLTPKEGEEPQKDLFGKDMYSCSVGSGVIRMKEIISQLMENGYDGTYAIEHFRSISQLSDMTASADFLKGELG